jgi:hypothetical protein
VEIEAKRKNPRSFRTGDNLKTKSVYSQTNFEAQMYALILNFRIFDQENQAKDAERHIQNPRRSADTCIQSLFVLILVA